MRGCIRDTNINDTNIWLDMRTEEDLNIENKLKEVKKEYDKVCGLIHARICTQGIGNYIPPDLLKRRDVLYKEKQRLIDERIRRESIDEYNRNNRTRK